jgi:TolB-like protein/Tfp pilus assembly protein PilF
MSFFEELKRRNVFRVAVAYLVTAWLSLQVADIVLETIEAPLWIMKVLMLLLGIGFPIALVFAWAFELTPEGLKKEKDVDRARSITRQTGRKLDFTIIGILVVAVVLLLVERCTGEAAEPAPAPAPEIAIAAEADAPAEPVDKVKSVAVLPFVNMSSDPEQEYFSDGISEEILNALAKVKDLKVAGRTSSFAFKGQNQDLRQIGDTLGVENILEGSVRKSGTMVRITAQLIQVDDGFHLWSETYDRELTDVFAIQDEIAGAILEQLKAQLLDDEQPAVATVRANSEAYDLYLLAKQRIYERTRPTLEAAAETLDRAIALDPQYAPAYAQRGITALLLKDEQYGTLTKDQSQTQAKIYLDQALRLDPNQPEALAGMGLYYNNIPGKSAQAIEYLERSLAINPNNIDASNWLQTVYSNVGRLDETVAILRQMAERDPLYRPGIANLNRFQVFLGNLDEAQAMVERVRPFMPNDPFLLRIEGNIAFARGQTAKGLRMVEEALALQPDNGPNIDLLAQGLINSAQYELALDERFSSWTRIEASWRLGRMEEATLLIWETANSGEDLGAPISFFANTGKPEQAIAYLEEHWDSLDAFEKDVPLLAGSIGTMLDIAYAYGRVGNEEWFNEAMERSRRALDEVRDMGFDNPNLQILDAVYYTMAGDRDRALLMLAKAVDGGYVSGTDMAFGWSALDVLEGEIEYQAIQARMVDHLNRERAELGLEQLTT